MIQSSFKRERTLPNYNEVFDGEAPRAPYRDLLAILEEIGPARMVARIQSANDILHREGVTFFVDGGRDRILPVDWLPRIITPSDWTRIERGLTQRVLALNRFCHEVYQGRQTIVPEELVKTSMYYYPECEGLRVPGDVYVHVYGPDILHLGAGRYVILEDNLRIPSGVSYAEKYREVTKRIFPEFFRACRMKRIDRYAAMFLTNLLQVRPADWDGSGGGVALLTEGSRNSAYYEHKYLSEQMGIPLVEPRDLFVDEGHACRMRTHDGTARVGVVYRRIQDLDMFVPGLSRSYLAGKVNLANAWGTGIVDDKAIFPYVPAMIKNYLGEEPLLPNVETYSLLDPKQRRHVVANLGRMVVKSREGYGGHDLMIGPEASRQELEEWKDRIIAYPLQYVAQECVEFSTHVLLQADPESFSLVETYVDLRTYVLYGKDGVSVLPGGITRVAQPGTHVVNSSSGGMIKDTWVMETE